LQGLRRYSHACLSYHSGIKHWNLETCYLSQKLKKNNTDTRMWILPPLFNPRMTSRGLCYQQNYRWSCQCPRLPGVGSQSTERLKKSVKTETVLCKNVLINFNFEKHFQRWQLSQEVSDRANKQWLYLESWKMILNELWFFSSSSWSDSSSEMSSKYSMIRPFDIFSSSSSFVSVSK